MLLALRRDTISFMGRVAEVQWRSMISVFCHSHVPALLTLQIPGFEERNRHCHIIGNCMRWTFHFAISCRGRN